MLNKNAKEFIVACEIKFGNEAVIDRDMITAIVNESGAPYPYWLVTKSEYRYDRGLYKVPTSGNPIKNTPAQPAKMVEQAEPALVDLSVVQLRQPKLIDESDPSIPAKYPDYVPFGFFKDLKNVLNSRHFYPVFI